MSMQEQFERAYAEDSDGVTVEEVRALRLGNDSYSSPKVSSAYYWWKRSRASLAIELPSEEPGYMYYAPDVVAAIEVHGLRVTP